MTIAPFLAIAAVILYFVWCALRKKEDAPSPASETNQKAQPASPFTPPKNLDQALQTAISFNDLGRTKELALWAKGKDEHERTLWAALRLAESKLTSEHPNHREGKFVAALRDAISDFNSSAHKAKKPRIELSDAAASRVIKQSAGEKGLAHEELQRRIQEARAQIASKTDDEILAMHQAGRHLNTDNQGVPPTPLATQLKKLAECGIALRPGIKNKSLYENDDALDEIESEPYLPLLCAMGSQDLSRSNIFFVDWSEFTASEAAPILRDLADGAFPLTAIEGSEYGDEDAWVGFALNGQTHRWDVSSRKEDMPSSAHLFKFSELFDSLNTGKRFAEIPTGDPTSLIVCLTPDQKTRLTALIGIEIEWMTDAERHWFE